MTLDISVPGSAHPSLGLGAPRLPSHEERQVNIGGQPISFPAPALSVRQPLALAGGFGSRPLSQFHHVSLPHGETLSRFRFLGRK